jgi:hypothetical protein
MLYLILYLLGSDIEFNPVFFAYAAVSLKEVTYRHPKISLLYLDILDIL